MAQNSVMPVDSASLPMGTRLHSYPISRRMSVSEVTAVQAALSKPYAPIPSGQSMTLEEKRKDRAWLSPAGLARSLAIE